MRPNILLAFFTSSSIKINLGKGLIFNPLSIIYWVNSLIYGKYSWVPNLSNESNTNILTAGLALDVFISFASGKLFSCFVFFLEVSLRLVIYSKARFKRFFTSGSLAFWYAALTR